MSPEEQKTASDRFDEGMKQYKGILLDEPKRKEKQFGSLVPHTRRTSSRRSGSIPSDWTTTNTCRGSKRMRTRSMGRG